MPEETTAHDFREVIETVICGRSPIIVGGHAVNIWAIRYEQRIGAEISQFQPFTSKDLDVYGTCELLDALHARLGGTKRLSEPRSPVVGKIEVELAGRHRSIDVLHSVRGLNAKDLEVVVPVKLDGFIALVPAPIKLLKAKIGNVATLEQTNRNDVKHLKMILLCQREFIVDFLDAAEAGDMTPRAVVNLLTETRTITGSSEAQKVARRWEIDYNSVWPWRRLEESPLDKVQNFLAHHCP
jgi:hypothetical protein